MDITIMVILNALIYTYLIFCGISFLKALTIIPHIPSLYRTWMNSMPKKVNPLVSKIVFTLSTTFVILERTFLWWTWND